VLQGNDQQPEVIHMQVIGHRGAAALAPENTWDSFDLALALGVDAIETDIRATSDGELVLIHDQQLQRTTNGQGLVNATSWSIIQTLDAGSWFSNQYRNARIPRLDSTLERYGQCTHLVLEIKQAGLETQVLQQVKALNLLNRVTFTAFNFATVQTIKTKAPEAYVGWLTADVQAETVERVLAAGLDQICLPAQMLARPQVADLQALGLNVRAWKVSDETAMISALQAGVDGMTIDFPHRLLAALGRSSSDRERLK
jgi:glycerophosphoryl diester phosphodiesterase